MGGDTIKAMCSVRVDGWTDGQVDGWMGGQTDGWVGTQGAEHDAGGTQGDREGACPAPPSWHEGRQGPGEDREGQTDRTGMC